VDRLHSRHEESTWEILVMVDLKASSLYAMAYVQFLFWGGFLVITYHRCQALYKVFHRLTVNLDA